MDEARARRVRDDIAKLSRAGLGWVEFATAASDALRRAIPFDRACWHTVDPGTVLFTGSLNQDVGCSGAWLAEHEYVVDDVNKWAFLARSGRLAGATSLATHGDMSRSARHRSHQAYGIGDELRGSFVSDGTYWGAVGLLREQDRPCFGEDEVRLLAALSRPAAHALRRALLQDAATADRPRDDSGPGVVVFDEHGDAESVSPAAERWIRDIVELPEPEHVGDSRVVQVVAARARAVTDPDAVEAAARARVRTRSGSWLLLYGTRLSGGAPGRTAVIVQPAPPHEVAPLVALAYGLSERECQVTRLCLQGRSTKEIAATLHVSAYTVQDHLKSIFEKTGARTRGELVGQVFLEHYVTRWEDLAEPPAGWIAKTCADPVG